MYVIGTLKGNSYVSMLKEVCNVPYLWTVVCEGCPFFVFVFLVVLILVGFLCCVCRFRSCKSFSEKLFFVRLIY